MNTEHAVVITRIREKNPKDEVMHKLEERREGGLGEVQARQIPGTTPLREARVVNRRRANFERAAYSATSNPTEERCQARTKPWTPGQDQDQTAIEREILVPFNEQYH